MLTEYIVMELEHDGTLERFWGLRDLAAKTNEEAEAAIAQYFSKPNQMLCDGPRLLVMKTFRYDE